MTKVDWDNTYPWTVNIGGWRLIRDKRDTSKKEFKRIYPTPNGYRFIGIATKYTTVLNWEMINYASKIMKISVNGCIVIWYRPNFNVASCFLWHRIQKQKSHSNNSCMLAENHCQSTPTNRYLSTVNTEEKLFTEHYDAIIKECV